jgi:glycolate oxidase FAD binding subunit
MAIDAPELQRALTEIVGAEQVRTASEADELDGLRPRLVVEPDRIETAALVLAYADRQGLAVVPRGGASRLGWGRPLEAADLVLSTRGLDQIVEHAAGDMTVTVQAGVTLEALQRELAQANQLLPLDVPWAERATLGGLVATDDSGSLRLRYGGLRDLIIGITVVRPDGVVAKAGGKVVKNVAGFDLAKLFTGACGTLGLVAEATFRLHPFPPATGTLVLRGATPEAAGAFLLAVLDSTLVPTGLTVIWPDDGAAMVMVRFGGLQAALEAQLAEASRLAEAHQLSGYQPTPADAAAAWQSAGQLAWEGGGPALVARVGILPAEIPVTLRAMETLAQQHESSAQAVIQAHGLGLIRAESSGATVGLAAFARGLRQRLAERQGTLVVLEAPPEVKAVVDPWGIRPDALALMQQVRQRFDPRGTMNPGRMMATRTASA